MKHWQSSFNPRARMGRDKLNSMQEILNNMFQSTRPHGARPRIREMKHWQSSFNPRARMGRDGFAEHREVANYWVSIHAPAWGATIYSPFNKPVDNVSIHAPAWGATYQP